MPQGADGGEATFCSWTRQAASKTQLGDRFPEAQAETTRIVERSGACIRSLLSRLTLQKTEVAGNAHPAPGEEAVDPLGGTDEAPGRAGRTPPCGDLSEFLLYGILLSPIVQRASAPRQWRWRKREQAPGGEREREPHFRALSLNLSLIVKL